MRLAGATVLLALIVRPLPARGAPEPAGPVAGPASPPVVAQSDDDDEDDDWLDDDDAFGDEDEPEDVDRPDEPEDDLEGDDDLEDDDWVPSEDEGEEPAGDFDLLEGEEDEDVLQAEGADTAAIYRAALKEMKELPPEEELLAWEEYLRRYPNTRFREQIEARQEELNDIIYNTRIEVPGGQQEDARHAELDFATGVQIEPIDPRTRARVGVEWGFPSWGNLLAEYEHAITRQFSAHAGIRHRYSGWNLEAGTRYALVKSPRTNMLVTGLLDLHFNANPFFLGVRPQVAVGKRLDVAGGLDLQAQVGTDLEVRSPFSYRILAGINAFLRLSGTVGVFLESTVNMRPGPEGAGPFAFNLLGVGMRFEPRKLPADILFSASAPYYQNYWGYHYGSAMVVAEYTF